MKFLIFISITPFLITCEKNEKLEKSIKSKESFGVILNKSQNGMYGYRSEDYRYDYTAIGIDDHGNDVSGNLNFNGNLGEGKIYSKFEKKTVEIIVEPAGKKNKVVGTDINGNKYFLSIK
ncbi:hypothetical protein [Flavobacterium algicola]|uniref:hypothetical protein n=1 Tax=Flavobacterium algicola TaxID=556529 RepID=UPI001EFD33F1|nr:hypothetical protein [Flavobacterium algicola]MCG9793667.1 hypothetical protein [Flavobacterium algicola]